MSSVLEFFRKYPELAATLFVGVSAFALYVADVAWVHWYVSAFALVMALILSWDMVKDIMGGAWGVDLLAITAIVSTVFVGEYWAALIVCLMLSGGESLEDYAAQRARSQLTGLLEGAPTTAHIVDADGGITDVDIEHVQVGDRLVVRPGEVVPVDGVLASEHATTEESSLTGEPLPVEHSRGDELFSGGLNGANAIVIEARATAEQSQYQQIISLVKQAQQSQAPVVRLADRVAVPFTLVAFVVAGLAWWISGDPVRLAQVLVVATPCPLLLAAPVAFLAGMNRAAKEGIIIKDSGTLEKLSRIRTVAMDKTGTLTVGHPELVGMKTAGDISERELLQTAAAIEVFSAHPLAAAVVSAAHSRAIDIPTATEATEESGRGVTGIVNGQTVQVGNSRWLNIADHGLDAEAGQILIHVARNGRWIGALIMEDTLRHDAAATVASMRDMGIEHVMMITGDGPATANAIGQRVGITEISHSLLPGQKVDAIGHTEHPVAAIGDGVNDAPVLATADVGIAMGARGSSAASESADVVIMLDDIYRAARSIAVGKRTMTVAIQAIGIGVGLSIILMLIGATGVMPAVVGAFMQEIIDLACILWALLAARPGAHEIPLERVIDPQNSQTGAGEYVSNTRI
ncbi:MAG: heavy metal translocating P-type ATPase [Actinomycetaceae bacterium]|nr:heavy metal translocating P-type ATPase [Actinomycetaceae bacterium]